MLCPLPIIELGKRYAEVPVGGLVAVVATDVAARTDVPAWCRMRGQEYVGEETAEDGSAALRRTPAQLMSLRCGCTSAAASAP